MNNNKILDKYFIHSTGENWLHFRCDPRSLIESFSVTYCHDGSVCMTGDMGCLVWQRKYFPEELDYGFPYAGTGIDYFAEKVVRAEESQVIRAWDHDAAVIDITEAMDEDRDVEDSYVLMAILDRVDMIESSEYGFFQMGEEFNSITHHIESEEWCEFGWRYSDMFKMRFELLRSVSDQILSYTKEKDGENVSKRLVDRLK